MTEQLDWGKEANVATKPKRRIPTWAWFCGGGCLIALLAVVAVVIVGVFLAKEAGDQDKQWTELQAELPFDERPADMEIQGTGVITGLAPGIEDQWTLVRRGSLVQVQVTKYDKRQGTQLREAIASGEFQGAGGSFGGFGLFGSEAGSANVQGRDLHWIRFQTYKPEESAESPETPAAPPEPEADKSPEELGVRDVLKQRIMMLDVTREGDEGALLVQMVKVGPGQQISPQDMIEFLAPFKLGPER